MCRLLYGQESKLPELFHQERAERSADEPDPVSVCTRRSPPCTPLSLQHSTWPTSEGFGASGPESGCGLRHSLRTELRRLPWLGRAWRGFDRPCQSSVSRHRRRKRGAQRCYQRRPWSFDARVRAKCRRNADGRTDQCDYERNFFTLGTQGNSRWSKPTFIRCKNDGECRTWGERFRNILRILPRIWG